MKNLKIDIDLDPNKHVGFLTPSELNRHAIIKSEIIKSCMHVDLTK